MTRKAWMSKYFSVSFQIRAWKPNVCMKLTEGSSRWKCRCFFPQSQRHQSSSSTYHASVSKSRRCHLRNLASAGSVQAPQFLKVGYRLQLNNSNKHWNNKPTWRRQACWNYHGTSQCIAFCQWYSFKFVNVISVEWQPNNFGSYFIAVAHYCSGNGHFCIKFWQTEVHL